MSAEIEQVMRSFGVHAGGPDHRKARAEALAAIGLTAEDVWLVGVHVERNTEDPMKVPRFLGALLKDPAKVKATVGDIRFAVAERERRAAGDGKVTADGDPRSYANGYVGEWRSTDPEDERQAVEADERARNGRVGCTSPADHAREMGVSEDAFAALAARGAALRASLLAPPAQEALQESIEEGDAAAAARNAQAFVDAGRAMPAVLVDEIKRTKADVKKAVRLRRVK